MLNAVTSVLARNRIGAEHLRLTQTSLEDAFVALTGRHPGAGQRPDQDWPDSSD